MSVALRLTALVALVLAVLAAPAAAQTTLPAGFQEQTALAGLSQTVGMAYAPDGRVFVIEKAGRVRVARTDGTLAPKLLLDLTARVNAYGDRGLLGVAVDKAFASNGFLYLLYAAETPLAPDSSGPTVARLVRVTVNPDNTVANPGAPETVILGTHAGPSCPAPDNAVDCIPADHYWHTIGTVRVDAVDGTLWLGSGDATGGSTQDQAFRTYDERSFAGKIIHVDRTGRGLAGHAFCPAESDLTKVCTKLHAKGFRNPFRFTLRPGKNPVVGDVGYTSQEEIDLPRKGGNYGWPCYEGTARTPGYLDHPRCAEEYAKEGTVTAALEPAYAYPRGDGASVTAGPQYTGADYPAEYAGDIFFGDYVQGWIKRLNVTADDVVTGVEPFAASAPAFVDLQQDPGGRVAFMDIGYFEPGLAAVRNFDYADDLRPTARASATPTSGAPPLAVQFTGSTSSDPEGGALAYAWDFGDGTPGSAVANPSHTYQEVGSYTATLTVTDPRGNKDSASVRIDAGSQNAAPAAAITAPTAGLLYRGGDTIALAATASDREDGTLPESAYSWQVLLVHNTHLHEHASATGSQASFVTATDHDADSSYEVRLTVRDSAGTTTRRTVAIKPKTVRFTLNSSPPGAPVTYGGTTAGASPVSVRAMVGYRASVSSAETFASGERTYRQKSWSDGGARSHVVRVPDYDSALLSSYAADGLDTFTFAPTADTSVDSGTPDTARGGASDLRVDASPVRQSYLRFGVAGLAGRRVVGARVALYNREGSVSGGRVFPTTTNTWTESGTTWNTRPALGTSLLATFGAVRAAEWFEQPLAAGTVTGDGSLSLAIDSTSSDSAYYGSRESSRAPRLVVETEPLPSQTLTFTPEADTSVSAAEPARSWGTAPKLYVDASPVRQSYLRFRVAGLAGRRILGVKLRMRQVDASSVGGAVRAVSSTGWTEAMTWDTRVPIDGAQLGAFGAVSAGQWYEAELGAGAVAAEGAVAFGLSSTSSDGADWSTRETVDKPQLLVTVAD